MSDPALRVALVTGGSRGIGRACALALAGDGCDVLLAYRKNEQAAADTVEEIAKAGRRAVAVRADMANSEDLSALAASVLAEFGRLDVLVHAAGIASRGSSVADTDPAEMDHVMGVNVMSAFELCRLLVPAMRGRGRADVVFISSIAVRVPVPNGAPYNMSKAALESLALTLAKEERRHGIHVNVVAPALVATDMGKRLMKAVRGVDDITTLDESAPFGRVCRPEDVAGVVRFLCSPEAGYLTGQVVVVDGGG